MDDYTASLEAKRRSLLQAGVRMMDPNTVYVEDSVTVGAGTLLLPGTILRGNTVIGRNCEIGPNTMLTGCIVEDNVTINSSQCNESKICSGTHVGPFAYIRPHCTVGPNVKVGDFVELKNSAIGDGCFIGCNTNLVAPVKLGDGCYTAAGSTITRDVEADALAVARSRQSELPGWAARHRKKKER